MRKATISFAITLLLSVHPSAWDTSAPNEKDFYEIWYLNIFPKSAQKIQVSLKSDRNNGHFTWRRVCLYDNISLTSSEDRSMSDKTRNKSFILNDFFNRAVCEIMWKNIVRRGRSQMAIWYGACPLHGGYLRLQTQSQNM